MISRNNNNLPKGWRKVKLGEVADVKTGSTDVKDAVKHGGYPLFDRSMEIKRSNKYLFDGTAIILPGEGREFFPRFYTGKFDLHQRAYAIFAHKNEIDPRYLYYAVLKERHIFSLWAVGSTVKSLRMPIIKAVEFYLPPIEIQKRIADILSAFDDKIELNNKISRTLEQMAQAIFKEWFGENSKFKNQNAKWETKNVMEIIKRIPVGKKYDNRSALPSGKVPILDQGASGCIGYHNDKPGVIASIDEPVVVFTNHTCNYRLMTRPFSAIQNVLPYIGINGYPTLFVYFLTKGKIKMQEYKGHWPEFEQQEFLVPPAELAQEFAIFIKPMVQKMVEVENENQKLAALRDLLLPKLMSGEIKV
jgi:type I restriction enzyme S subunit